MPFETNIFINCPFDDDFSPILQALLFAIIYLGYDPRLATETIDSADNRLDRISGLIESSKFSIHDLSRCQAETAGEHYRLNMPFELGIDYACKLYRGEGRETKKILVLEEQRYRYQAALSDLAGCDIESHGGDAETAIRKVRNWIVSETSISADGAGRIWAGYQDFQEWYFERQLEQGFSESDIRDYPTNELLEAMREWFLLRQLL